jgi:HEAT repeat
MEMNDPDVKCNAATALSYLLDDFGCRIELRNYSGLNLILEQLSSQYPEIQEAALKCLAKASEDGNHRGLHSWK